MPPTVQSVKEVRSFEINTTTGSGTREFRVQFIAADIVAFDYEEKAFEARNAVDPDTGFAIPQEGTSLNATRWASIVVDTIEAEQFEAQNNLWLVTVEYLGFESDGSLKGVDPWDEPWVFDWNSLARQSILRGDFSSPRRAILNSAGFPPTENVLVDDPLRRLVISRKDRISDFDPLTTINFFGGINSVPTDVEVFTFGTNVIRVDKWNGVTAQKEVIVGGVATIKDYYQVTIELAFNPKGWEGFLLDTGKKEREVPYNPRTELPANAGERTINDKFGIPDPGPHLLNGFGQRLINADGSKNTPINTDGIVINNTLSTDRGVYLRYRFHQEGLLNPDMRLDQQP